MSEAAVKPVPLSVLSIGPDCKVPPTSYQNILTVVACVATRLAKVCSWRPHFNAFAFLSPENSVKAAAGCSKQDLLTPRGST